MTPLDSTSSSICLLYTSITYALTAKIPHSYLLLLLTSTICKKAMRKGSYTKLCFDCPRFPTDKRGMLMSFLLFLSGIQACPNKKTYQAISFLISSSMPVSYTHLDVYKRQALRLSAFNDSFAVMSYSSLLFAYVSLIIKAYPFYKGLSLDAALSTG